MGGRGQKTAGMVMTHKGKWTESILNVVHNTVAQKLHFIQTWSRKTKTLVSIVLNKVAIIDFQLGSRFRWWAIFWQLYFWLKETFIVICFSCKKVVTCLKCRRRHLWMTLCCDEGQVSQNMTMSYLPVIFNITRWVNGLPPFTTFLSSLALYS